MDVTTKTLCARHRSMPPYYLVDAQKAGKVLNIIPHEIPELYGDEFVSIINDGKQFDS